MKNTKKKGNLIFVWVILPILMYLIHLVLVGNQIFKSTLTHKQAIELGLYNRDSTLLITPFSLIQHTTIVHLAVSIVLVITVFIIAEGKYNQGTLTLVIFLSGVIGIIIDGLLLNTQSGGLANGSMGIIGLMLSPIIFNDYKSTNEKVVQCLLWAVPFLIVAITVNILSSVGFIAPMIALIVGFLLGLIFKNEEIERNDLFNETDFDTIA